MAWRGDSVTKGETKKTNEGEMWSQSAREEGRGNCIGVRGDKTEPETEKTHEGERWT